MFAQKVLDQSDRIGMVPYHRPEDKTKSSPVYEWDKYDLPVEKAPLSGGDDNFSFSEVYLNELTELDTEVFFNIAEKSRADFRMFGSANDVYEFWFDLNDQNPQDPGVYVIDIEDSNYPAKTKPDYSNLSEFLSLIN